MTSGVGANGPGLKPGRKGESPMLKARRIACLVAALLLLQTSAHAWGDTGHMVVAQIALDSLKGTEEERERKVEELNRLAGLVRYGDTEYEFATLACWMDDIRSEPSYELLKDWHFITLRYIVSGPAQDEPPPPVNVASVIKMTRDKLFDKEKDKDVQKAYYLAVLAHLIGDIHQPLHAATRYTAELPEGDRGGNKFIIKAPNGASSNLHSFWDAAGGYFAGALVERPLDQDMSELLDRHARDIMKDFPKAAFQQELGNYDPMRWAASSHELAREKVHKGVTENAKPSPAYTDAAQELSRRRIALAGYRLAQILDYLR
jgi:hypothetical protein